LLEFELVEVTGFSSTLPIRESSAQVLNLSDFPPRTHVVTLGCVAAAPPLVDV
jgi:hypothetical protein